MVYVDYNLLLRIEVRYKMKKSIIILLFLSSFWMSVEAQNPNYPMGLSFKASFMDYQSQNGGSITDFASYHHGFEIGLHKNLSENLNILVPVKAGVVNTHNRELEDCVHKNVYGADIQLQYQFYKPDTRLTPYVMAGVGGIQEDEGELNIQIPFGAGLFFHVRDNAYINWQSSYRYSLAENRNNLEHGIGFVYLFGNPQEKPIEAENTGILDSDGDGLEDDIDLCPQIAGPVELKGCPDRDMDGVPDYRDDCPSIKGLTLFKGCPDTDGDGISDNDDECPNKPGVKEKNGCPDEDDMKDTDGDGILDKDDKCPDEKGDLLNDGCPKVDLDSDGDGVPDASDKCPNLKGDGVDGCPKATIADRDGDGVADAQDKCPDQPGLSVYGGCPDTDGDGIDDSRDRCPNSAGPVSSNGCPEISASDRSTLEVAMRAVSFDTGKSTLRQESFSILDQITQIMNRYPDYNLIIEGHTDNVGSAVNNQLLSERRAKACYDYLRDQGYVDSNRMTHTGYGESRPVASNDSLAQRKLNRRVEFNLVPR